MLSLVFRHGLRAKTYTAADYYQEFGRVITALKADPKISSVANKLIGPSLSNQWAPEDVWNTGFIQEYNSSCQALAMERYAHDGRLYPPLSDISTVTRVTIARECSIPVLLLFLRKYSRAIWTTTRESLSLSRSSTGK